MSTLETTLDQSLEDSVLIDGATARKVGELASQEVNAQAAETNPEDHEAMDAIAEAQDIILAYKDQIAGRVPSHSRMDAVLEAEQS